MNEHLTHRVSIATLITIGIFLIMSITYITQSKEEISEAILCMDEEVQDSLSVQNANGQHHLEVKN